MMACAQLGITLCGVLLGALGEPAVAALLEPVFAVARRAGGVAAPGRAGDRAAARGLRARGARRDGAEEHRHRRAGANRARAGAGPAGDRHGHRADHPDPEPFANCGRPATGRRAQGRGDVGLHPRGGRRPGGRVAARRACWTTRSTSGSPRRWTSTPPTVGAVMVPDAEVMSRRARGHRRRDRADLRPDRVLPLPDPRARRPILRLPAHPRRHRHPGRPARRAGAARRDPARCRRWRLSTDLRTALDRMRRIGAHLAEVAGSRSAAGGRESARWTVTPVVGAVEPDRRCVSRAGSGDAGGRHRGADRRDPRRHPPSPDRPAAGVRRRRGLTDAEPHGYVSAHAAPDHGDRNRVRDHLHVPRSAPAQPGRGRPLPVPPRRRPGVGRRTCSCATVPGCTSTSDRIPSTPPPSATTCRR